MKRFIKFIKKNMLLCLIVIFCVLMWIYGALLYKAGYKLTGENENQPLIALALTKISDGIYPWNMNNNKPDDFGFVKNVETIELYGNAFGNEETVSDNSSLDNCISNNKVAEDINADKAGLTDKNESEEYIVGPVPISYFDDAVFVGDSRMEGVYEYAGLNNATFLTKVSMSIYSMMDSKVSNPDYKTVLEGLSDKQYGKVYIMVGINEIGTANTEYFVSHYLDVINQIKELQPNAIIVVQAILHVTASRNDSDKYFNNTNINERNEGLKSLANGKDIFYLDVNPIYDDEEGNLIEEYSSDNIHLYANKYAAWKEFYLDNGFYKSSQDPFEGHEAERRQKKDLTASGNSISDNTVSDNIASDITASNYIASNNSASDNTVSDNTVSNNTVSVNKSSANSESANVESDNSASVDKASDKNALDNNVSVNAISNNTTSANKASINTTSVDTAIDKNAISNNSLLKNSVSQEKLLNSKQSDDKLLEDKAINDEMHEKQLENARKLIDIVSKYYNF